ncbi:MAG: LiaI-LiaF-like domain-containing protein [Candidatus Limnocylindrales bacterium]
MTIRRGSLYAGVFVLAVGAVALANTTGALDRSLAADAVGGLWPVAVIAIGLAMLLRRTQASLPAGFIAAAAPGLLLGGALVAAPATPCTGPSSGTPVQTQQGSITGTGAIGLHLACGELRVSTQPGGGWRLDSTDGTGRHTQVSATPDGFTASSDGQANRWPGGGPVTWVATLPTAPTLDLVARVDAGRGRLDLGGATLRTVDLGVDAGDLRTDLAGATLERLSLEVNAGSSTLALPADAFTGDITANAGSVRVCVPAGLGLRVNAQELLGSVRFNGLIRNGDMWTAPQSTSTPPNIADLTVNASVGSVTFNPEGGCK